MNKGVTQGSILGPLLFTLSINGLGDHIKYNSFRLYVDDTIIYPIVPSVGKAIKNLQSDFDVVQNTFVNLKLLLNSDKTK